MIWFAARTILGGIFALLAAALIAFLCLDVPPAGSSKAFDFGATAARFIGWLAGLFSGSFGLSAQAAPVGTLIGGRLAVTLPLIALAVLFAAFVSAAIGYGTTRRAPILERGLRTLAQLLGALPNFWLGMLLVILFAVTLRWLPASGFVPWTSNAPLALASLILPALSLGLPLGAMLGLAISSEVALARNAPPIRAALARGMSAEDAFRAHGVRAAALGVLAAAVPLVLTLAAGSVVIETVFSLPGLGRLMLDGAASRDVVVVRSAILVLTAVSAVLFVLLRLAAGWADPRISRRAPA